VHEIGHLIGASHERGYVAHGNEWRDIMSNKANFEQAYPALPRRAPRPYWRAASRFPLGPEPRLAHGVFVELLGDDHLQISACDGLVTNTDLASDPSCEANDGPDLKEVWRTPRRAGTDGVKCRAVGVPLGPEPDGTTSWLLSIRTMPSAHTECIGRSLLSSQTAVVAHGSWQETLHGGQPSRGRHPPVTAFLSRDGV
jgi:hypothetical protein